MILSRVFIRRWHVHRFELGPDAWLGDALVRVSRRGQPEGIGKLAVPAFLLAANERQNLLLRYLTTETTGRRKPCWQTGSSQ